MLEFRVTAVFVVGALTIFLAIQLDSVPLTEGSRLLRLARAFDPRGTWGAAGAITRRVVAGIDYQSGGLGPAPGEAGGVLGARRAAALEQKALRRRRRRRLNAFSGGRCVRVRPQQRACNNASCTLSVEGGSPQLDIEWLHRSVARWFRYYYHHGTHEHIWRVCACPAGPAALPDYGCG